MTNHERRMQDIADEKRQAQERGEERWAKHGGWITGICLATGVGGALAGPWGALLTLIIGGYLYLFLKVWR